MDVQHQIDEHLASLPDVRRSDMQELHRRMLDLMPGCQLWFVDGRDKTGKVVSNPDIGYGNCTIPYANGTSREFYKIGISANKSGISVYVFGLTDKQFLASTYGSTLGKANISSYCIKFKALKDINMAVLDDVIQTCVAGNM